MTQMAFGPTGNLVEAREQVRALKHELQGLTEGITELNRAMNTYFALARRSGLPEEIALGINKVLQLKVAFEMTYRSAMLLYTATGPAGWAIGLGGLALSGFMLADQMATRRPYY